jgi:isopentenyldiphosphate isomerase
MEQLLIVHEHTNEPTGVVLPRHEAITKDVWCRSTNVFVMNGKGELLCHQRSMKKDRYPGVWSTHLGGHVTHEETYELNALKELEEEAGITKLPQEIIPWRTTKISRSRLWAKDFVTHHDADIQDLVPQEGEIEFFCWMGLEDIIHEAKQNPGQWFAGVNDLRVEYYCARSALVAAHALGAIQTPKEIHAWHPIAATI